MTTTTPIADVSPACAALWSPYGVTKVPPANLADGTPVPPAVVNETNGAVSDAQANAWALADSRGSRWFQWAEANVQPGLLGHLGIVGLVPGVEMQALAAGNSVVQPECAVFPTAVRLFPLQAADVPFFATLGESVGVGYVFVDSYPANCSVTAVTPDGQSKVIESYPTASRTFNPGYLAADALLGTVWYVNGGANCGNPGAPIQWCAA
ncbi:MAG: hypothetical protein M3R48_07170, partial [Candidatus Dormibacteraeota bacterium]|nr:hypothetical protein [Candidatus Dormibacteraeota bacterium]